VGSEDLETIGEKGGPSTAVIIGTATAPDAHTETGDAITTPRSVVIGSKNDAEEADVTHGGATTITDQMENTSQVRTEEEDMTIFQGIASRKGATGSSQIAVWMTESMMMRIGEVITTTVITWINEFQIETTDVQSRKMMIMEGRTVHMIEKEDQFLDVREASIIVTGHLDWAEIVGDFARVQEMIQLLMFLTVHMDIRCKMAILESEDMRKLITEPHHAATHLSPITKRGACHNYIVHYYL
jgi:hypothetical protein